MTCHMTVSLFVCVLKCCAYIVFLYVCFSETVVVILCLSVTQVLCLYCVSVYVGSLSIVHLGTLTHTMISLP